ncbi:MAG: transposase [Nitrospirae bacterium]|nr:transposase [Nitrospirota bacterium]
MANTRLAIGAEVRDGNQFTSKHVAPGLCQYLDSLPEKCRPVFIRGDASFGVEPLMIEAEARGIDCLMKLRLTAKVKRLIRKLFAYEQWTDAGCGFTAQEAGLQLSGWSRSRRVIVLRRTFKGEIALVG